MSVEFNKDVILKKEAVDEVRKACKQFAMLYFNFVKTLVERYGIDAAKEIIQVTLFGLALERSNAMRDRAYELGIDCTVETMKEVTDIPFLGWDELKGKDHCPYAEQWNKYYADYPWFKEFAPFYCDVIDTTNYENFTRTVTQKITKNVLCENNVCERVFLEKDDLKQGQYTYGIKK